MKKILTNLINHRHVLARQETTIVSIMLVKLNCTNVTMCLTDKPSKLRHIFSHHRLLALS
jgi:hypothetical protein